MDLSLVFNLNPVLSVQERLSKTSKADARD